MRKSTANATKPSNPIELKPVRRPGLVQPHDSSFASGEGPLPVPPTLVAPPLPPAKLPAPPALDAPALPPHAVPPVAAGTLASQLPKISHVDDHESRQAAPL